MEPIIIPGKAKKRAKMTAIERAKFKKERAEARANEQNEMIATKEEVEALLDRIMGPKNDTPAVQNEEVKTPTEVKN